MKTLLAKGCDNPTFFECAPLRREREIPKKLSTSSSLAPNTAYSVRAGVVLISLVAPTGGVLDDTITVLYGGGSVSLIDGLSSKQIYSFSDASDLNQSIRFVYDGAGWIKA